MKFQFYRLLSATLLGLCLVAPVGAQQDSTGGDAGQPLSPAMQKSMDPNVWINLMNRMMSGELQGQPMMQMANPQMIGPMMAPMGGMMAPMMAPMGSMMVPMTGMMMNPMTGMMMNPMTGMMMPGMMPGMPPAGMMPGMPPTGMMPPFPTMPHPGGTIAPGTKPGQPPLMDPKQYEQFYKQWQDMMSKMMPAQPGAAEQQ